MALLATTCANLAFQKAVSDFAQAKHFDNELVRKLWPASPPFTENDAQRARAAALHTASRLGLRDAPDELIPSLRATREYGEIWDAAYAAACGNRGVTTDSHD